MVYGNKHLSKKINLGDTYDYCNITNLSLTCDSSHIFL